MAVSELFDISGQVAIVTGASSGLGRIMARALADAGCAVVITARTEPALHELRDEIQRAGGRACVVACDVRDPAHAQRLVDVAVTTFGRLDGVVLNAGICVGAPAEDEELDDVRDTLEVNVVAVLNLAAACARKMMGNGGGWMITLSSILGKRAGTGVGLASYVASKGAVETLTRELTRQWGPHRIRINAIAPGVIPTPMNEPMMEVPGRRDQFLARIPLGRLGEPDDLAGLVVFLASPAAAYITGQSIGLDGGMSVW